jgi:predicted kinase
MHPTIEFEPGTLAVMVGISGAGKTTFTAGYPRSWRISLDDVREWATDDAADQSATPVAAQVQALILDARLARGLTTVVDSTNVLPHVRAGLLARARYWQRPAAAVLFDLPLATCLARNAARTRVVPDDVLRSQHQRLPDHEQLLAEGWAAVHVLPAAVPAG